MATKVTRHATQSLKAITKQSSFTQHAYKGNAIIIISREKSLLNASFDNTLLLRNSFLNQRF